MKRDETRIKIIANSSKKEVGEEEKKQRYGLPIT